GSHVGDEQHVGRLDARLDLEVLARLVVEHRRRERPERLAVLDLVVHDRLHGWRARVADDRAVPDRTRPELHPSLQEPDDPAVGPMLSTTSSVATWIDAAGSSSRSVISDSGARGGPPNRSAKRRFVIVSPER